MRGICLNSLLSVLRWKVIRFILYCSNPFHSETNETTKLVVFKVVRDNNLRLLQEVDTMKAVAYIRVSTKEQAQEGVSLSQQLEKIKHFCLAKDWELTKVYQDEGKSGANLNREGIQELLSDCKKGEYDVIVVYKLDRLTRSVKDLGYLIELFDKHEIAFSSVSDNFDTTTANGRLVLNILGSVAQWEREIIAERTEDALQHKKANRKIYGAIPLGFDLGEDGKLIENKQELRIVRKIKDLRQRGISLGNIAGRLNSDNIPTKKNRKWYAGTVKYILENDLYV